MEGLIQSTNGGTMALLGALFSALFFHIFTKIREKNKEKEQVLAFLASIKAEVEAVWDRYYETMGHIVNSLEGNRYISEKYLATNDYFTVFNNNADMLGRITDQELRKQIVDFYIKVKGFVDTFNTNNNKLEIYHNALLLKGSIVYPYEHTPEEMEKILIGQAYIIKKEHNEIKKRLKELTTNIENYHNKYRRVFFILK